MHPLLLRGGYWRETLRSEPMSTTTMNPKKLCESVSAEQCLPTALSLKVMQSPPPACLSVRLFPLYLSNRLAFALDLLRTCGSLPWLAGD